MKKYKLYDWVLHYNPYKEVWQAARREDINLLFSESESKKLIKAARIEVLVEILEKTDGDLSKLNYINE